MSASTFCQLIEFLASPERPEGTLRYHELQGFFFAITCSPELIPPSEWMPMIFNGKEAGYADMEEARLILQTLMDLYNQINEQVLTTEIALPDDIITQESPTDNIGDTTDLGQWCTGFVIGHDWLAELWDTYTPQELDQELDSAVITLTFFSNQKLAEAYQQEIRHKKPLSLDELAALLFSVFEEAMKSYAYMGWSIQTALFEESKPQEPYVSEGKIGRNAPCPCGSSKKYKKCCGIN